MSSIPIVGGEVKLYTFEDSDGTRLYHNETDLYAAVEYAREQNCLLIENTYRWVDDDPLRDFRTDERKRANGVIGLSQAGDPDGPSPEPETECWECGATIVGEPAFYFTGTDDLVACGDCAGPHLEADDGEIEEVDDAALQALRGGYP